MSTVVRDEQPGTSTAHPDRSPLPPQLLLTEEGGDQIIADQGLGSGLVVGNAGVAVYTNSTKEAGVLRSSFPVEGQLALSTDVGRFNELLTQTARSAATTQDVTAGLTTTIRVQDGATIAIGGPGIDNTFEMHFTAVPSTEQQWTSEWAPRPPQLSEEDFYRLAEEAPDQLIALVNANTLRPSDLTFAAEALGEVHSSPAKEALLRLLQNDAALVREGAVYGLADHLDEDARAALRRVGESDSSPGVRESALEVLAE